MIVLRFDVNDGALREAFLDHLLMDALTPLGVDDPYRTSMSALVMECRPERRRHT